MDTYTLHITGKHAIRLMRLARRGDVVTAESAPGHMLEGFGKKPASLADLRMDDLVSALKISEEDPLELLVPRDSSRLWSGADISRLRTKLLSVALPSDSFLEVKAGKGPGAVQWAPETKIYITNPALESAYVAQAAKATQTSDLRAFLRILEFLDECCGTYVRDPFDPFAGTVTYDDRLEPTNFVTPQLVISYLQEVKGIDGLPLARKAARQAIDGSGSPMETYLNHALVLPRKYAGLSMKRPLANKQLVLDEAHRRNLKHGTLRPDLQWPEYKVLAEYLGEAEHASRHARVEDKNRMQDYASTPYTAFPLMFDDVKNATALNKTALMIGREFARHGAKNEPSRLKKLITDQTFLANQRVLISVLLPPVKRYEQ